MDLSLKIGLKDFISEKISILICSKNRREMLESLLKDLQQLYSDYSVEIVVVEESNFEKAISGVKYFCHPISNRGFGYTRNLALKHANKDIIVFVDDDCKVLNGWLENLIEPMFSDNTVMGVQGGVTVPEQSNIIGWAESILGFPGGGIKRIVDAKGINIQTKEISTLNCAYRRKAINDVGGFDEQFIHGGEDYILAKQVSNYGKCFFVPLALVTHEPRGNLRKIWSWFVRRGQAEIKVIQSGKYKEANYKSIIRGSLGIKLALFISAGSFISCSIIYTLGFIFFLYGYITYTRYFKIWKSSRASIFAFFMLPIVKSTMDLATDYGRLKGIIRK